MLKLMGPNAGGKGQGHGQLNDLIILIHLGLQGWEAEDGAAGSVANQGYLKRGSNEGRWTDTMWTAGIERPPGP